MDYLKSYKLYKVQESLIEDISDRFLDLEDDGYHVDINNVTDIPISFKGKKMIHSDDIQEYFISEHAVNLIQIVIEIKPEVEQVVPNDEWSSERGFNLSDIKETIITSIDMVSDTHRLDCYFIKTPTLRGTSGYSYDNTDRFGNNCYFENFDDLPDRVKKLYIYFIPLDI